MSNRKLPVDSLENFLCVRGLSTNWLIEQCEEVQSNDWDSKITLEILADLIRAGVPLPPIAVELVFKVLQELSKGQDPRTSLRILPKPGRPVSEKGENRMVQAGACLALMSLADFPRGVSVRLVSTAIGLVEREVENIIVPQLTGDWNHRDYLMETGYKVLKQVMDVPLHDVDLSAWRAKLREFCS